MIEIKKIEGQHPTRLDILVYLQMSDPLSIDPNEAVVSSVVSSSIGNQAKVFSPLMTLVTNTKQLGSKILPTMCFVGGKRIEVSSYYKAKKISDLIIEDLKTCDFSRARVLAVLHDGKVEPVIIGSEKLLQNIRKYIAEVVPVGAMVVIDDYRMIYA
jgi:hypothetical protein